MSVCLSVCLSVQYSTSLLESYVPQCYQYREAQNIGCVVLARGASKILGHKNQTHARACDISPICPDPPTWAIAFVFGMHGDFAGAITRANFFVDRFRGFRVLRLQYFYSPYTLSWSPLQQCYTVITCHFCVPMHIRCPGCILKSKKKFRQQSCRNFYS